MKRHPAKPHRLHQAARPPARRRVYRPAVEPLEPRLAPANVDVLSFHNNLFLNAQNLQEETLTPANVNATSFGKLVSQPVDGPIYAQPLYKANLMIGGTPHNVAFVATEHDSVYAFDLMDSATAGVTVSQIWKTSFINPAAGITPIPASELGNPDIVPEIGITGTPVIDGATNTIYVLARTKEVRSSVPHYVEKLHALDITTGAEKFGGPYQIGDTTLGGADGGWTNTTSIVVAGDGDGAGPDHMVRFNAGREMQRPAMQLVTNADSSKTVYVAWASQADFRPYHGWVIGFNASTLQPVRWFNTTPNAGGAGIWQSGGGLSVDPQGNLYFAEGNGFNGPDPAFDPTHGNYSESVLKLTPSGSQLTVPDYFTPYDWQSLDTQDADLGSGGAMLLPDFVGSTAHPHLMVELGKSGKLYLIDRDNMGRINNPGIGPDLVVQTVTAGQRGVWGNPAFFSTNAGNGMPGSGSGMIYYHGSDDVLKGYVISNGHIDDVNILHSSFNSQFPGTQPIVSANGIANPTSPTNAITWELQVDARGLGQTPSTPAILRAFLAGNLATELYDSSQTGLRDQPDPGNKFTTITETNGRVLVGTFGYFSVYGLFPAATAVPPARSNLVGTLGSGTQGPQIQLTWTNPAPTAGAVPTGIKILRSTDGTTFTLYTTVARDATSYTDTGPFVIGQHYYYQVVAANQQGDAAPSNTVNVLVPIASSVLTLTGASASSVGLAWTPVANDHYAIERSTDGGTTFTAVATVPSFQTSYTDTGLSPGIYAYRIHAFNTNPAAESLSNVLGASVGATIDHNAGFTNTTDLTPNGSTQFAETTVRLTNGPTQTGSAFSNTRITTARFTTTFQLRIHEGTQPNYADGITFVLQANAPTALGQGLGGLGYQGIGHSVAVKFSTFQHTGDPSSSSTGLVLNGANPSGGMDTTPSGVLLNSQDQKQITLTYDGTTLTEQILDIPRNLTFSTSYTVNIPQVIGSDTAYVGFTGATGSGSVEGGYWEDHDIVTWRFTSQAPLPGAPSNLRVASSASTEIDLAWNGNSYNETTFQVERSSDGTSFTQIGTATGTSFKDLGLLNGTYYYRVRAVNGAGNSAYSNTLQTGVPGQILTQDQDVGTPGDPAVPGHASFAAGGVYTDAGAGSDIWNQADGFHFVYKPLLGDGTITARVLSMSSIQDTTFWAKAGVMIRESLAGNARDAYVTMTPQGHNQVQFLDRAATGGNAADIGDAFNIAFPIWVRVVRQGNNFTGYYSTDGSNFIQLGPTVAIPMAPTAYVGLVASAADSNGAPPTAVSTAMFDHVSVVPAVLQTSHLDVSASVPAVNPGTPLRITVQALDQYNNPVPGYRGTVHFTSSDMGANLPANYTFTAADNGSHTFTLTLQTLGTQSIFVTDTATSAITGGTAVLVTNQPVLAALTVAGFPTSTVAGVAHSFTVTAVDAGGNTFTGYRGTVHFTSSDPRAQLPMDYPFTAADNGVHTFMATLNTPGTQSLTASDTASQVSGSQTGIQVVAPPSLTTVSRSAAVINQGGTLTVSGTFTDPTTGQTHQVDISWGDGSADTMLSLAAGVLTFSAGHPYTTVGSFEIHVTVTGANNGSDTVILTASATSAAPPSGLVGWWTGDGTSTTTAPDIGGVNPGTLVNGATHAPGEVGNAFSFNGSNWVAIPTGTNIPVGNTPYTLLAWIKPNAAGNEGIIGYGNYGTNNQTNAFRLLDDGTGHLNFRHYWWGNDLDAFTTIPANNGVWHLAVAEFDGTTREVILDGQVIGMDRPTGHAVPDTRFFAIGVTDFNGSGGETFNGLIDEAQIYSRALTTAEIQAIYGAGTAGEIKGVQVQAVPPPAITTVSRSAAVINEGGSLTLNGTFTDPVMGQTHQAVIHWGDGSTDTTIPLAVGVLNFSATHPYTEEGNFTIAVTVTSANSGTDTVNLTATAAAVAPPAGLVSWWTGDDNSATTAPDIAGTNPGTLVGGATHAAGEVGNAFSFNGNGQYVNLPTGTNVPVGNATYTLLAWIKPNAAINGGIIGYGNYGTNNQVNAFRVLDNGTGHLNLLNYWWANDLEADTNVPATGAWHLAVAEFDGTTRNILLDGQVVATDHPTGHNVPNTANFRIGSTNNGEFFNGLIDETQVYSRALTTAEIQAIYNAGTAGEIKGVRANDVAVMATGGLPFTAAEGTDSASQAVATFTDPGGHEDLTDYAATIAWGDTGTSMGTITFNSATGVFTVSGSHRYAEEGAQTITVTITHDMAPSAMVTDTLTVSDPAVMATGNFPLAAVEGGNTGTQTVATFTDPAGFEPLVDYSATVAWGDTSSSAGTITYDAGTGVFTVTASHAYTEEGSYPVTVTITHDAAPMTTAVDTATVSDPDVVPTGGLTVNAVEGATSASQPVATFTDPAGAEDPANYQATIDWGDNSTSAGTITYDAGTGTFTVSGSHAYAEEGSYPVTVSVTHEQNAPLAAVSTAAVNDPSVAGNGGFSVQASEGSDTGMVTVATFTDPGGAEALNDYSATIDWGDGQVTPGFISYDADSGLFTVQGSNAYAEEGTYPITVTLSHDAAPDVQVMSTAVVADPPVAANGGYIVNATAGQDTGFQTVAQFTDPAGPEILTDYAAVIDWGDQVQTLGEIDFNTASEIFTVTGHHTYAFSGSYTITVTIEHDAAPLTTVFSAAMVTDPGPQPALLSGGVLPLAPAVTSPAARTPAPPAAAASSPRVAAADQAQDLGSPTVPGDSQAPRLVTSPPVAGALAAIDGAFGSDTPSWIDGFWYK